MRSPPSTGGRARRRSAAGAVAIALLAAACGRGGPGSRSPEAGSLRLAGIGAAADPTLRPATLVPESVDESASYGTEPGGGSRVIVAGLRVVASPDGAITAASDRLPQPPQLTTALPERLGGGFLFLLGATIWRSDRWLEAAKPLFTPPLPVQAILPGLDRVYLRAQSTVLAIDGRSGRLLDLGPWPASPRVTSYAAADGWHAAAVTDLRGVVATFDAGASWRPLDLPLEGKHVAVSNESLAIGGFEQGLEAWYELRADGSTTRLDAPPRGVKVKLTPTPVRSAGGSSSTVRPARRPTVSPSAEASPDRAERSALASDQDDVAAKIFGKRPLAAAIEDGWPLTDGTAVVARDGALARVRLQDGALIDLVRGAFPLEAARCHPVTLTRPKAVGAFGFVCGEPRGRTILYAYDPLGGRLVELKRFDKPRVVSSSGNGALAVRGSCAESGEDTPPARPREAKLPSAKEGRTTPEGPGSKIDDAAAQPAPSDVRPYCVLGHDDGWREIHVRGSAGGERVVVLADGRVVVVSPPEHLDAPARITVLDRAMNAKTAPVVFPRVTSDVARVLRLGLWLDGFEERRPGVIGGWIEAGGVMLGLEIALDGRATPGQFIRDAGSPFVSGRYGLGWTASRRGYETTDGGMTWSSVELPDPLVPATRVDARACGPVGCLAYGWLRLGWGEAKHAPTPPVPLPPRPSAAVAAPQVKLACEPLASAPPPVKESASPSVRAPGPRLTFGGFGGPPVLGSFNGLTELPPFFSQSAPSLRDPERGINIDVRELLDRHPNVGSLARVYGWGPRTGDWETLGRWQVKWLSPFAGWPEVRASLPAPPPPMIVDMTRTSGALSGGMYYGVHSNYQLAPGDDDAHALLVAKRAGRWDTVVYELEADRSPIEVRRADGETFGEIEGVVRAGGQWLLATAAGPAGAAPASIVWKIEGAVAREHARVPRAWSDGVAPAATRVKLARRSDGRAIGLVVDGEPTFERPVSVRWALPIDLETGALGEPEALGWSDLAGRALDACTDDVLGWVLDVPIPSSVRLQLPRGSGAINGVLARVRMTSARACIERIAGTYDGQSAGRAAELVLPLAPRPAQASLRPGEVLVTAMAHQIRFPLRCTTRPVGR